MSFKNNIVFWMYQQTSHSQRLNKRIKILSWFGTQIDFLIILGCKKKAEEKLKCINLAYKELSAVHRRAKAQQTTTTATPHEPDSRSQGPQGTRHSQKNNPCQPQAQSQSSGHPKTCHSDISLEQAHFIVSHFHFRRLKRTTGQRKYFKSGPFRLELNLLDQQVLLENLCDSINGFHPILLTIPCKASGLFSGAEAQQLITLFQTYQGE